MSGQILHEEKIYKGRVFDLVRVKFRLPNQSEHTFDLVKHHGAVTVVPVDQKGNIWFVRQFRVGADADLLELPAGLLEQDEAPEASAARELQEETGWGANKMIRLGEFYMVPGYSTEKLQAFLATDLFESALQGDEDEFLEKVAVPIAQVYEMVHSGQIKDGKTLAALLLAKPYLEQLTGTKA